jgi:RNA polymerase sigma factor (sigma-70 family)
MPTRPPTARLIPTLRRAVLASPAAGPTDGQLLAEFVRVADPDAFAALVRRHGPMVLGVCRRLAGNPHDADDAFQAVFVVLARRAASVRPREQVGNWLYGVAYRTALKARAIQARRRTREAQVDPMPHPPTPPPDVWSDLRPVIDAELARLPDRLRLPIVLCDLEGRAQREVAKQLGLPPATLANRLASARRVVAKRLTERGITLSGGALAAVVSANAANAAVPPTLATAAVRAAGLVAAGGALTGAVPAQVVQLSEGVIRMMLLTKLKAATVAVLVAVAGGLGALPVLATDPAGRPASGARVDPTKPGLGPHLTDEEFLQRVCENLRGTRPSDVEVRYFVADTDAAKRKKVVRWLTEPGNVDLEARLRIDFTNLVAESREHTLTAGKGYIELPVAGQPGWQVNRLAQVEPQTGHEREALGLAANFVEIDAPRQGGWLGLVFADEPHDSKRYHVIITGGGAGEQVFRFPATDSVTVLDALANINYKPPVRSKQRVWVARRSPDPGRPEQVLPVDYAGITQHGVTLTNYQIMPGDRVYVSADPQPANPNGVEWSVEQPGVELSYLLLAADSDEQFLSRVCQDVRGGPPTAIEREYFLADQDPNKREKLLDTFLKDPTVAKKLGAEWKKRLLGTADQTLRLHYKLYQRQQAETYRLWLKATDARPNRLETLLGQLLDGKRTDDQVLDALAAAVLGRLPTESERRLILAAVAKAPDKAAAWREVIAALGGTDEAKTHAEKK